jgi:hypothetical protein
MAMVIQFPDELVKEFERLNLKVVAHAEGVTLEVQSTLEQEIRKWQLDDAGIQKIKGSMKQGEAPDFTEDEQGTVWVKNRLCVPETRNLRETILREAHDSAYSIHPGSTKMHQDLKQRYWWYGLKRDVAAHVALCDTCHRVYPPGGVPLRGSTCCDKVRAVRETWLAYTIDLQFYSFNGTVDKGS